MGGTTTTGRPRRRRSDGERSRQAILRGAANLATVDGLRGLSIGGLAAHIGMSKSGLYAHFGSKEELQLATVTTAREIFDAEIVQPTQAIDDPLERLQALCEGFLSYLERRVFPGGCFFASGAAELDTHPGPVKDEIASVQQHWLDQLRQLIRDAQRAGSLDAAVPMVHDHEAIVARIDRLGRADVDDVDTLQELLYGLYALIGVHFSKEEDIQLPAFDAAPPELTESVLERMEAATSQLHEHAH